METAALTGADFAADLSWILSHVKSAAKFYSAVDPTLIYGHHYTTHKSSRCYYRVPGSYHSAFPNLSIAVQETGKGG